MVAEKYITSSCLITNQGVFKNGELLFENTGTDAAGYLISIYEHFDIDYSRFYKMDSLSKLGWLASEILLHKSFNAGTYTEYDVGLVFSNSYSSLDTDRKYMASVSDIPRSSIFVYTLPNIVSGEICIRNNFKGENVFFIFERFNAEFIESYVTDLLDNNVLRACICGWVELLGDEYKAVLFLVEKLATRDAILFTKEQMKKIFDNENAMLN